MGVPIIAGAGVAVGSPVGLLVVSSVNIGVAVGKDMLFCEQAQIFMSRKNINNIKKSLFIVTSIVFLLKVDE